MPFGLGRVRPGLFDVGLHLVLVGAVCCPRRPGPFAIPLASVHGLKKDMLVRFDAENPAPLISGENVIREFESNNRIHELIKFTTKIPNPDLFVGMMPEVFASTRPRRPGRGFAHPQVSINTAFRMLKAMALR